MPRGRPRKNPVAVSPEAEAPEPIKTQSDSDALADLKAALAKAIDADPEATQKAMADVLGVAQATPRKVEERPRKIEIPKSALKIEAPEAPEDPEPGVLFGSPHQGFRQVLKPSQKKYYGDGNVDIIPPVVAEFEQGQVRLTDQDLIDAMRAKIKKQKEKGGVVQVVEMDPELAEGVKAVTGRVLGAKAPTVSQTTSIHDKLADLVQ